MSGLQDGGKWDKEDVFSMVPWQFFLPAVSQAGNQRGEFMGKQSFLGKQLQDHERPGISWAGNGVALWPSWR